MIRFFKSLQPATLFIIPVIVLLLWVQAFFSHPAAVNAEGTHLQNILINWFSFLPGFVQVLITIVLISFEAIYLSILANRHEVLYRNSYLPAFMYALIMSCAMPLLHFHSLLLVNLLMLVVLDKTFTLFKIESPISPLFDSSFLIGIASLIYYPAAVFFILFLIAISILRPFNLREWVIAFIGFLLPCFFLSVYFFWTDQWPEGWKNVISNLVPGSFNTAFAWNNSLQLLTIFFSGLLLLSLYQLRKSYYKNVIRTRSYQQIIFLYLLFAAASVLLLRKVPVDHFTIIAIPLAVIFSHYFLSANKRPWLSELILWLMIGVIIWNHFQKV